MRGRPGNSDGTADAAARAADGAGGEKADWRRRVIGAIHVHPGITIPAAVTLAGWIAWYWVRLGRAEEPESRRRIRRASIIAMLVSLPIFVRALSFVDPETDPQTYVTIWPLALFMLLLVVVTAGLDLANNIRLAAQQRMEELERGAAELAESMREARAAGLRGGRRGGAEPP
jgi:hypothetical protein